MSSFCCLKLIFDSSVDESARGNFLPGEKFKTWLQTQMQLQVLN